jgi:hypothetical protein
MSSSCPDAACGSPAPLSSRPLRRPARPALRPCRPATSSPRPRPRGSRGHAESRRHGDAGRPDHAVAQRDPSGVASDAAWERSECAPEGDLGAVQGPKPARDARAPLQRPGRLELGPVERGLDHRIVPADQDRHDRSHPAARPRLEDVGQPALDPGRPLRARSRDARTDRRLGRTRRRSAGPARTRPPSSGWTRDRRRSRHGAGGRGPPVRQPRCPSPTADPRRSESRISPTRAGGAAVAEHPLEVGELAGVARRASEERACSPRQQRPSHQEPAGRRDLRLVGGRAGQHEPQVQRPAREARDTGHEQPTARNGR